MKRTQVETNSYLIKQLPRATIFLNKNLEVVYVSDRWVNDFEFINGEVIGKKINGLLHTSINLQKDFKSCLKGNPGSKIQESYTSGNNDKRWVEWVNIPWYDENENVIGVIATTDDVTNEVQIESLQLIIKEKSTNAKIGSWQYDAELDNLWWCDMAKEIHEAPKDFAPNIETLIDFHVEGHSKNTISMALFEASTKGIPWKEKLQIVTELGNEKWIISAGKPIFKNDKYIGLIGTFQDINEQVQTTNKIRENELLLKTLINSLPLNVFIKDLDSRKILVNKAEMEFFGLDDKSQIIGKTDYNFFDKKTADRTREEDLKVMENDLPLLNEENSAIKQNGDITSFLTSKIPLKDASGKVTGLIGFSIDISDIKKKEEELTNLINVTSLQNKKLVNFAHIVSHNLRSHAANFSMLLEFLTSEKEEIEKQNLTQMLVVASNNLMETLDNLNEVIAINANATLDKKKPINLSKKISKVEKNLKGFLKKNNVKMKVFVVVILPPLYLWRR